MKIKQTLTNVEQIVSLPTVDVINGSPSKIETMIIDRAGYPDIRNLSYVLVKSEGDMMNFKVTGQTMLSQSVPDEDTAVAEEERPLVTVTGDEA